MNSNAGFAFPSFQGSWRNRSHLKTDVSDCCLRRSLCTIRDLRRIKTSRHGWSQHKAPAASMSVLRWAKVAAGVTGVVAASFLPSDLRQHMRGNILSAPLVNATETVEVPVHDAGSSIPLSKLGIKIEDFMSHRELASRKTTQYSEAEEEIMELEEDEIEFQYFYNLQAMWAAIASVGGIFALYKGGVLWENWITEQERKDMEEEIELTGTFIDPRAVRKEENEENDKDKNKKKKKDDEENNNKGPKNKKGDPSDSGPDSDSPPDTGDLPPDGIDALERLFGKS